eukprot:7846419-Pyramimonas_sp.AAC.1
MHRGRRRSRFRRPARVQGPRMRSSLDRYECHRLSSSRRFAPRLWLGVASPGGAASSVRGDIVWGG